MNIIPFERSYWVIPGKVLAGEIPSSLNNDTRINKLQQLLNLKIDVIINLMESNEKTFTGELLVDYIHELKILSEKRNQEINVKRFPIKDLQIPTIEFMKEILQFLKKCIDENKKVYIHCWGGVGRTGTVVGCFLQDNCGVTSENVIEMITYLKRTTSIVNRDSPETKEQMDFVKNWIQKSKV
jgi:protein tyrosine/serine phosphatase